MKKLSKAAYVDAIVTGVEEEEQAFQLFTKSKEILKEGGFNLRKFYSNSTLLQMKVDGQKHWTILLPLALMKLTPIQPSTGGSQYALGRGTCLDSAGMWQLNCQLAGRRQ